MLASGSLDNEVRLWNANTAECVGSRDFCKCFFLSSSQRSSRLFSEFYWEPITPILFYWSVGNHRVVLLPEDVVSC